MPNNSPSSKDMWDKLDAIGKILSGVVLVLIAFVLKIGSDNIAASLQRGDLVQRLITDLSTTDKRIKQDIALIALDDAIGEQSPLLVADVAEVIFRDLKEDYQTGNRAFMILTKRNLEKSKKIQEDLSAQASKLQADVRSAVDTSQPIQNEVSPQAQLIARALPNIIYIQFNDEGHRPLAKELQGELKGKGLNAPGVEKVDGNYGNSIRYFHDEDQRLALQVKDSVETFFKKKSDQKNFQLQDLSQRFKTQKGQIEIWMNLRSP